MTEEKMGVEFELKFTADPQIQEKIADVYFGNDQSYQMCTTYYDTPSGALSARRITLRCRLENGEAVCTVKTPMDGYGRGEWDCRCEDIRKSIPILCAQGAPEELLQLTAEGIVEVCDARFKRRAATVSFGNEVLEIALDQGVLTGGGKEEPLCEVEVELKSGAPELAVAFAMDLKERFQLIPQNKSKFRRALALAKGE
jgi:inorganic triphosphatase YgiF